MATLLDEVLNFIVSEKAGYMISVWKKVHVMGWLLSYRCFSCMKCLFFALFDLFNTWFLH